MGESADPRFYERVLAIAGLTPIGFVAAIGSALLVLVLSIMLSTRARSAAPAA